MPALLRSAQVGPADGAVQAGLERPHQADLLAPRGRLDSLA